jgi:hypothetical protein
VISAAQVNAVIEEKALWSLLSSHLMYMYNRLYNTIMPQGR